MRSSTTGSSIWNLHRIPSISMASCIRFVCQIHGKETTVICSFYFCAVPYEPFIFEPSSGVDESDLEISDEFVLLRAKDAADRKEPRRLTRIEITPASASIKPGDSVKFAASGYDQHGSPFGDTNVTWSATGGTIDQGGRFSAEEIGNFRVEARSDSFVGAATISVQTAPPPPPGNGCAWQGTVPPQKWMNFYTKVLS